MNYYKISKDNWSCIQKYNTLKEAQSFADTLGEGYIVKYMSPVIPMSVEERYGHDTMFCQSLIDEFVLDNRNATTTQEQNSALMVKFRDILQFAQVGAVKDINTHLPNISTDEVFTQERKDKYIQMITNYLSQFTYL